MSDLTLLYYTAGRIDARFAENVMQELVHAAPGVPIIAVCHGREGLVPPIHVVLKPKAFVDVGRLEPSIYQVYRNILTAAQQAETPYVACCEDDTLYSPEHFRYRPALDTFAYDLSRWVLTRELSADGRRREGLFYWRERHQMAMCVAPRALLIETLDERFDKYPEPVPHDAAKRTGWGEPGRYEKNLGLTPRKMQYFNADAPSVTFNHGASLMGRRRVNPDDVIERELPPWGNATALWDRVHG